MRCSSCEPLLDRYVEATLPARKMIAISAHLESCAHCRELLAELRVVDALLATTAPVDLPVNFTFAVMAEARTMHAPRRRHLSMWSVLTIYIVAAWIALGGAWIAFGSHGARVAASLASLSNGAGHAMAALSSAAHALAPAAPITVIGVGGILTIDVVLACAVIAFYRFVRPRLAERLATSEVLSS